MDAGARQRMNYCWRTYLNAPEVKELLFSEMVLHVQGEEKEVMSLKPEPIGPIPQETARVAKAACPKGSTFIQMRDVLGVLFEDSKFVNLFSPDGQPALVPWRLALVTIMQFAEGLSDRQAAEAVRKRIGEYRLPKGKEKRTSVVEMIGSDGSALLDAIVSTQELNWLQHVPAVEVLRRVWVQQFEVVDGKRRFRSDESIPSPAKMICSPRRLWRPPMGAS